MIGHESFVAEIVAAPDDDEPRLVYADYLEERGDPLGEFIRVQCDLAQMRPGEGRYRELSLRQHQLMQAHGVAWQGVLAGVAQHVRFERGFPAYAEIRASKFLQWAEVAFQENPVRALKITHVKRHINAFAYFPPLNQVEGLDLSDQQLGPQRTTRLLRSKHLTGLRRLNLRGNRIDAYAMRVLAKEATLGDLELLDLSDNRLSVAALEHLVRAPCITKLQHLRLASNYLAPAGSHLIAESPQLGSLEGLDLTQTEIHNSGARALTESVTLGELRQLSLGDNGITPEGAMAITRPLRWKKLECLDLSGNSVGDAAAQILARRAILPELTQLKLPDPDGRSPTTDRLLLERFPYLHHQRGGRLYTTEAVAKLSASCATI